MSRDNQHRNPFLAKGISMRLNRLLLVDRLFHTSNRTCARIARWRASRSTIARAARSTRPRAGTITASRKAHSSDSCNHEMLHGNPPNLSFTSSLESISLTFMGVVLRRGATMSSRSCTLWHIFFVLFPKVKNYFSTMPSPTFSGARV